MVQWLRPHALHAGGAGSIPGQGTQILHASAKKKKIVKMTPFVLYILFHNLIFFKPIRIPSEP